MYICVFETYIYFFVFIKQDYIVVWRPRQFNKIADGLTDLTMDRGENWFRRYELSKKRCQGNGLAFSDGGKRSGGMSAAAWLILMLFWEDSRWQVEPWAAGGIVLSSEASVLEAEARGLEAAVEFLSIEAASMA